MKISPLISFFDLRLLCYYHPSNKVALYTFPLICSHLNVFFKFMYWIKCIFLWRRNITFPCQTLVCHRLLHFVVFTVSKHNFVTYSKIYDSNMNDVKCYDFFVEIMTFKRIWLIKFTRWCFGLCLCVFLKT